jgi:UDP-N-acetylglucosamine 3-dehydrogenase
MLNVIVVGGGYIGLSHIAAYKQLDNARVVGVVDLNKEVGEKAAEEAGCKHYSTLEEALEAEKANMVDICVPTFLHEDFVVKAANAKCHVLCEKPVTFTLESFDRMINACRENNVKFMVAQVARWWPEFTVIKDYFDQNQLGRIHMIYEKRLAQHPNWATWHRDPEKSGGGLYDLNIHDIDFLYSVLGMPKSVYAVGWKSPSGCWNHISTSLVWEDGTKAVCETSLEMTGNYPFSIEFRGTGDKGTLEYIFAAGFNIKDETSGSRFVFYPEGEENVQELEAEQKDMFVEEIGSFVNAVVEDKPLPISPEESRDVLRITLAIKKSLEEGVVVEF